MGSKEAQQVPPEAKKFFAELRKRANLVAEAANADVYVYSGNIGPPTDDEVVEECIGRVNRRTNAILLLTTFGGDAHAAYRIARCFQENYHRFSVMVAGFCKSAGTLLLIGAHDLVLFEQAELGPLDVQLRKADELAERSSGLTPMQALTVLEQRALGAFENSFIKMKLELMMTTKTAADIASSLATGLYQPVFAQVDPMRLGEMDRATRVAMEYGTRLDKRGQNLQENALARLVAQYPAHEFVIDTYEAREIFKNVRGPTKAERALVQLIHDFARTPLDSGTGVIKHYLNETADGQDASPGPDGGDLQEDRAHPSGSGSSGGAPVSPDGEADASPRPINGDGAVE